MFYLLCEGIGDKDLWTMSRIEKLKGRGFFYVESIRIIRVKDMPERRSRKQMCGNGLQLESKYFVENPILK